MRPHVLTDCDDVVIQWMLFDAMVIGVIVVAFVHVMITSGIIVMVVVAIVVIIVADSSACLNHRH